jgi:hypothetical protein
MSGDEHRSLSTIGAEKKKLVTFKVHFELLLLEIVE